MSRGDRGIDNRQLNGLGGKIQTENQRGEKGLGKIITLGGRKKNISFGQNSNQYRVGGTRIYLSKKKKEGGVEREGGDRIWF